MTSREEHRGLALSVIVPTYDAAATIGATLRAIRASSLPRDRYELIVVDDASGDETATAAARHADTVVRLTGRPSGPAYARNRGAELARAPMLAFVDADVLVGPDTFARLLGELERNPELCAASATYDDTPAATNFTSQYWNLLIHLGMRQSAARGSHLLAACAVIRRSSLSGSGMYDEWRFRSPCLEDVELGHRLSASGGAGSKVRTIPEIGVTHLKEATLAGVMQVVWQRGGLLARSLGYSRTLLHAPGDVIFTLARPGMQGLVTVGALAVSAEWTSNSALPILVGLATTLVCLLNFRVFRFFAQQRGFWFAARVVPVHLAAQLVSVVALLSGFALRHLVGDLLPDATTQAYAEVGVEMWPPVPRRA